MTSARMTRTSSYESAGLPRPVRIAVVGVAVFAVIGAGVARWTGAGHITIPGATPTLTRSVAFVDRADGGVAALDGVTGDSVATFAPGTNGFVRGALRALARQRRLNSIGPTAPFRLTRWSDGRLTLDDSTTGSHVELDGFGPTNVAAFASLLPPASR
jgi:putative photosynthetic complex assembly protein